MKTASTLVAALVTLVACTGKTNATLIFTVDSFTTDNLTITLPAGPNPNTLVGSEFSQDLFLIATSASQAASWITGDNASISASGIIGNQAIDLSQTAVFDDFEMTGIDIARITFDSNLTAGDTVTSELTASWTGTNLFAPSAVESLTLVWGGSNFGVTFPFGSIQSSVSVIPEPSSALLLGCAFLGIITLRRRKN